MEQLQNYATSQWINMQKIGFTDDPVYTKIIEKSIESYARGMLRKDSEYIFAIDNNGTLKFSTADINYNHIY